MKHTLFVLVFLALLFVTTVPALAHQAGGLDARGGHHCWSKCARYGLYTGQYHCHAWPCTTSDITRHRRHGH